MISGRIKKIFSFIQLLIFIKSIPTRSKLDFAKLFFQQLFFPNVITCTMYIFPNRFLRNTMSHYWRTAALPVSPTGLCESDVYFILDTTWSPGRIKTFQSTDLKCEFYSVITSCCWHPSSDVWGLPQGKTTKQIKKEKMHNVRSCPDACQSWLKLAYRGGCSTLENRVKISWSS